jgi:thymidylate kinase
MHISPKTGGTKFVSFSGIDGAGKSTQIENLCARLQEQGIRVIQIKFWDDIAQLKNIREHTGHAVFKGDKGVGSPSKPINRRDKNIQSLPMTAVRLCIYLIDAVSTRLAVNKALHSKNADFVIFDRYIYDELANLNLRYPVIRAYVWLIMKLVPKPNISYLLDADPAKARARKPEYPLDFLYSNRQTYLHLSRLVGMNVIAPLSIQEVMQEVVGLAFGQLPGLAMTCATNDCEDTKLEGSHLPAA